jgi:hypothetical protein
LVKEISNTSIEDALEDQAKLDAFRAAIRAGIDSGVAEGDVKARILERFANGPKSRNNTPCTFPICRHKLP